MKTLIALFLTSILTGCGVIPMQEVKGTDGRTYTWIAPFGSGEGYASGTSAGVTTYTGTVNGRGYSISSFK